MPSLTAELAGIECLKNRGMILLSTLAPFYLQVKRTTIKSKMSLTIGPIRPWTVDLAALERLKRISIDL